MDSLCRVCIKRAEKCTSLNSKIEDSSNLSYLGFLNKCTSLNAGESDSLPQTLCTICANSVKTFYSFVKLAEDSDIILREALKRLIAKGTYKGSGEISCEEITIRNAKIEEGSEDFNQGHSFYCQPSRNSTGQKLSILDIVKKEPIVDLKDAEINEGGKFESNQEHPKGNVEELDDILSCTDRRVASIDAGHSDAADEASISLLKNKLGKNEDVIDTHNEILFDARCIPSNVKKKTDKKEPKRARLIKQEILDPQSIVGLSGLIDNGKISCEEITIRNEKIEEDFKDFNKEDSFHCQPNKNSTGSSLVILDIVKEEPRLSERTSIVGLTDAEINESEKFDCNLNHSERSIEEPDDVLSCIDGRLGSLGTEHTDSEDDLPISTRLLLKKGLAKNWDEADSLRNSFEEITIRNKTIRHGCEICGKQFCTKLYLKEHQEYHKGITPKCDQCGKEFTHIHSLRKHLRRHTNPNYEKCEICGRIFSSKYYLSVHMESHGGITQKCNQCGKEYNNSRSLRNHMNWHANPKPYACEICGKFFAWKNNFTRHMDICKRPGEPKKLNTTKVECEICGQKISSKQYLNFHMESHAGITQKCDQCGKEYKNIISLRNHMKLHTNRKLFKCKNCGKSLSSKYNYAKHMDICKHPGKHQLKKLKFKCDICGKQFCTAYYLNLHIMKNHKGITHKCDKCGKEYLTIIMLRKHMQRHANPNPFKCENCGKFFAWKWNYTRHMRLCKPAGNSFEETVTIEKQSLHPEGNKDIAGKVTY